MIFTQTEQFKISHTKNKNCKYNKIYLIMSVNQKALSEKASSKQIFNHIYDTRGFRMGRTMRRLTFQCFSPRNSKRKKPL